MPIFNSPYLDRLLAFNSSLPRLWAENAAFARIVPKGALVLDAGAGSSPYKTLFSHAKYESADFHKVDKKYSPTTYVCDLKSIPTEDNRFNFIIFNQVLEHLPEPQLVLAELYRVLKPGGKMIYSGPLCYEEHEKPYDFYRYTQFGLQYLFGATGFEIERLDWLEGYYGTIGYQLKGMARNLRPKPRYIAPGLMGFALLPFMLLVKIGFGIGSVFFHRLEIQMKFTKKGYPLNYVAVVRKPLE